MKHLRDFSACHLYSSLWAQAEEMHSGSGGPGKEVEPERIYVLLSRDERGGAR